MTHLNPLVSCIMPTANRRRFVPQAIRSFMAQDYPNRELVILDDGSDSVADLMPGDPRVRYVRQARGQTLGAKRNECVRQSHGDLIMHWDDDDWMAPHRITYQVAALLSAGAEVAGLRRMLFYEPATGDTWLYDYPAGQRPWLAGGSLLYTRDFWRRAPFPDLQVASDTHFIWSQSLDRAAILPDYTFYVAMIHPGNTSSKARDSGYWTRWPGDIAAIMGDDLAFYRPLAPAAPTYSIIMIAHNAREMTRMATLRTLRHSADQDARLVIVDNASTDGTAIWLDMLARRGDIDLFRAGANIGHGPAIELARRGVRSPYIVTLDSDAFPLVDGWLARLRALLDGGAMIAGIRHHRDYIHPACLMVERRTLEELSLTFLNEKDQPSQLDVAERISCEIKRRGGRIAELERTGALRRGSASEPVYLGSSYEGLVHHQWYTTRAATSAGGLVDDVPAEAIERSLREVLARYDAEPREVTVVVGVRVPAGEPERLRNAIACLQAFNLQDVPRWRYRIVVVEQDSAPRHEAELAPLADRYLFARNPGPYNRSWGFNLGAAGADGALCLSDADLLVPPDFLSRGLEALRAGSRAVLPYREIIYLDAPSTEQAIRNLLAGRDDRGQVFTTSQGGCIFVDASLYREIGGHDEDFRGWGREDREFWDRLSRATPVARLPGRLAHLDHPRPAMEDAWAQANARRYERLQHAPAALRPIGDPERYRAEIVGDSAIEPRPPAPPRPEELGRRDWEGWHRWGAARIEQIVHDEQRQPAELSARAQLAALLPRLGASLLDVGCGPGALWPRLEPYRPGMTWAGVDATPEMLAVAQRLFPHIPVRHADAAALPFADRSFDVVLLRHVLEHLPHSLMERALREALRVARRAIALAFYLPPLASGARRTTRVGGQFLETQWADTDIAAPIAAAGWSVGQRQALPGLEGARDVVWIAMPRQSALAGQEQSVITTPRDAAISEPAASPGARLKISIIMPTYRRPHTLLRTIATIRAQTHHNWELIVVDNAGDVGDCFDDQRIRLYRYTERPSASAARNYGLLRATGNLICFFDDDDEMFSRYLERFAAALAANPLASMARCGMIVSDESVNYSYATPECCLRRPFATPSWASDYPAHDQIYFARIIAQHGWSEARGDIVLIPEALCRANADPTGGLRAGAL